ncbi:MAG: class SAM-dependent methyltransferase [Conexibacter sp.]|jgi:SAM-dependent methyltransferase|nr:class SAM-dependent methyltransferase [Conexibacter sp.]
MSADATDTDPQRRINDALWSREDLVSHYADRTLRPPEVMALIRRREALSGRVLELGCGAGRLTGYLVELAGAFHAIDVLPSMVEHCRRAYPAGTFAVGDLRDLSAHGDRSFDAIVASYAVLDVLGDAERRRVLGDLHRLLAEDGLLLMSTHNLAYAPRIREQLRVRTRRPVGVLRELVRLPRRIRNRRRLLPLQRVEPEYAILTDEGHDFSVLHYYIGRDTQERQLRESGFELLECLDLDGRPVAAGDDAASCPELHYLARRV